MGNLVIQAIISGLVGGLITGAVVVITMRVEIKYLRRDIDRAHALIIDLAGLLADLKNTILQKVRL